MKAHNSRQLCSFMGWLEGGGVENCAEIQRIVSTGALPLKL